MEKMVLTDEQYKKSMIDLGFTYDEESDKFFWFDWVFFDNVKDNVNTVFDLIKFNDKGYPTYMSIVLNDLMCRGGKFAIANGGIDEYGRKCNKALYCTNYNELFFLKSKKRIR